MPKITAAKMSNTGFFLFTPMGHDSTRQILSLKAGPFADQDDLERAQTDETWPDTYPCCFDPLTALDAAVVMDEDQPFRDLMDAMRKDGTKLTPAQKPYLSASWRTHTPSGTPSHDQMTIHSIPFGSRLTAMDWAEFCESLQENEGRTFGVLTLLDPGRAKLSP